MLDKSLIEERMNICKKCPIYKEHSIHGGICDSSKYISKDGQRWSYFKKDGFVKGCGCKLNNKTKYSTNHCIIDLW